MRQNYKFYAKKRKNTKTKKWPQQIGAKKKKKNKAGKTTTNIFSNREQYLLATYADNNISLQQKAIEQQ